MMQYFLSLLGKTALLAPPILLALTVHEAMHALVANWRGDPTAKHAGRLTLNPLKHLDPGGTLMFFVTAWLGSGIGWAKPVPVDYRMLRNPRGDLMLISAAGPVANLLTACLLAVILNLLVNTGLFHDFALWKLYLGEIIIIGVQVNLVLAMFNLLPLPPLDGSGILAGLLPEEAAARYHALGRYGFLVVLALIFLPTFIKGAPDIIGLAVVGPARWLMGVLLPQIY